jgi:hypothetical protein
MHETIIGLRSETALKEEQAETILMCEAIALL